MSNEGSPEAQESNQIRLVTTKEVLKKLQEDDVRLHEKNETEAVAINVEEEKIRSAADHMSLQKVDEETIEQFKKSHEELLNIRRKDLEKSRAYVASRVERHATMAADLAAIHQNPDTVKESSEPTKH